MQAVTFFLSCFFKKKSPIDNRPEIFSYLSKGLKYIMGPR